MRGGKRREEKMGRKGLKEGKIERNGRREEYKII